jgi:hypothetical protein
MGTLLRGKDMGRTLIANHSHWGAFSAIVEDGRVVGTKPFALDPDPSPLIDAIPDAVHSPTRIRCPMVRSGWLKRGPGSGAGRGREAFVPTSWARALDLVAGELSRVRSVHGPTAIMGGSAGWGSAGHFHEARGQLRRFLAACGGFVDQTSNYSFGTALTLLPHILGSAQAVTGPLTSWSSIVRHTRLLVLFGGANPKNTQVAKGGCAWHGTSGWIAALARAGALLVRRAERHAKLRGDDLRSRCAGGRVVALDRVQYPATVHRLAAGAGSEGSKDLPAGAGQGCNNLGVSQYSGPCPPVGNHADHYEITVYAVKVAQLPLDNTASGATVSSQLRPDTLATAKIVGRYERSK